MIVIVCYGCYFWIFDELFDIYYLVLYNYIIGFDVLFIFYDFFNENIIIFYV